MVEACKEMKQHKAQGKEENERRKLLLIEISVKSLLQLYYNERGRPPYIHRKGKQRKR